MSTNPRPADAIAPDIPVAPTTITALAPETDDRPDTSPSLARCLHGTPDTLAKRANFTSSAEVPIMMSTVLPAEAWNVARQRNLISTMSDPPGSVTDFLVLLPEISACWISTRRPRSDDGPTCTGPSMMGVLRADAATVPADTSPNAPRRNTDILPLRRADAEMPSVTRPADAETSVALIC